MVIDKCEKMEIEYMKAIALGSMAAMIKKVRKLCMHYVLSIFSGLTCSFNHLPIEYGISQHTPMLLAPGNLSTEDALKTRHDLPEVRVKNRKPY